jgi:hypothetical protein
MYDYSEKKKEARQFVKKKKSKEFVNNKNHDRNKIYDL